MSVHDLSEARQGRRRKAEGQADTRVPHNLEAEESVLGSMLYNPASVAIALPLVNPADFYCPTNVIICSTIYDLANGGVHIDTVTVSDALERAGELERVGGHQHLVSLMAGGCYANQVAGRAEVVARHAQARHLLCLAGELAESVYDGVEPSVIVAKLRDDVDELTGATNRKNRLFNAADAMLEHLDVIAARADDDQQAITGIRTGWHDFDELIGGLRSGQLIVIAGRPGVGKSAVAANIALRTAVTGGRRVLTVSIEMSLEELKDRYIAAVARVPLSSVRSGELSPRDWALANEAAGKFDERNLWVLDDPNATIPAIQAAAQRMEAELVIVDYLQIAKALGEHKNRTREREVAELSAGLKRMARDLGIPVVALSQFNREVDSRHSDKRPQLTDLRESGAIENDADAVIGLFREDYYDPNLPDAKRGVLEMIVLKQRNGPIGTACVKFEARTGRIGNMARVTV